jgi:hypothetical protein
MESKYLDDFAHALLKTDFITLGGSMADLDALLETMGITGIGLPINGVYKDKLKGVFNRVNPTESETLYHGLRFDTYLGPFSPVKIDELITELNIPWVYHLHDHGMMLHGNKNFEVVDILDGVDLPMFVADILFWGAHGPLSLRSREAHLHDIERRFYNWMGKYIDLSKSYSIYRALPENPEFYRDLNLLFDYDKYLELSVVERCKLVVKLNAEDSYPNLENCLQDEDIKGTPYQGVAGTDDLFDILAKNALYILIDHYGDEDRLKGAFGLKDTDYPKHLRVRYLTKAWLVEICESDSTLWRLSQILYQISFGKLHYGRMQPGWHTELMDLLRGTKVFVNNVSVKGIMSTDVIHELYRFVRRYQIPLMFYAKAGYVTVEAQALALELIEQLNQLKARLNYELPFTK